MGSADVGGEVSEGTEKVQVDSHVVPGNGSAPGMAGPSSLGDGAGGQLPLQERGESVPDAVRGDEANCGDEAGQGGQGSVHMVGPPVLESVTKSDSTPFVMRPQAERMVELIRQGWDVDVIFERIGVTIRE